MGKPCFFRIIKFFAIALLGAAAAIAAIAVLSSPAAAVPGGGGGRTEKSWDTDNLRFGSYSSASFRVPSHDYGRNADRYSHDACGRGGVADGFYQTRSDVNDFPVLVHKDGSYSEKAWGSSDLPCDEFVRAQERMVSEAAGNGGYWLDSDGKLRSGSLPVWIGARPVSLTYATWGDKGLLYSARTIAAVDIAGKRYYYAHNSSSSVGVTSDAGYQRRLDVFSTRAPAADWAVYPSSATLEVVWGSYTANPTGRYLYSRQVSASTLGSVAKLGKIAMPASGGSYSLYNNRYLSSAYSVGGGSIAICPAGFHPRGEDSVERIGNTTGRTLSHLTHAEGQIADRYWCRSDLRFLRKLYPYTRPGVALHPQAQNMSATEPFYAYGRVNCFYTADTATQPQNSGTTGVKSIGNSSYGCEYPYHPLPQCDPDPDNGSDTDWRAYTATEIAASGTVGQVFNKDPGADCAATSTPATPPQQAGFTADACVTASLEIYENRIAGSDAVPGVLSSDRTLAAAAGRTAWDLDIASPHPLTASPPRDATAGSGDPDGCADGSESRADHAASSGDAARSQSVAPSYASSARTDSAAPPNDADGDIDYSGAVKNIAHRYASRVAENTCAVKKAEAEAYLDLLKRRAGQFSGASGSSSFAWRYRTAAQSYRNEYRNLKNRLSNTSFYPSVYPSSNAFPNGYWRDWYNTNKPLLIAYFTAKETAWGNLDSAIETARVAHRRTADAAVLVDYSSGSCVAHWNSEMERLEDLFSDTETGGAGKVFLDAIKPYETAAEDDTVVNGKVIIAGVTKPPTSSSEQTDTLLSQEAAVYGEETLCSNTGSPPDENGSCTRRNVCPIFASCPPTPTYTSTGTTYIPASKSGTHSSVRTTTIRYNGNTRTVSTSCPGPLAAADVYPTTTSWFGISISLRWTGWQYSNCAHSEQNALRVSQIIGTPISLPSVPAPKTIPPSSVSPPAQISFNKANILNTYHPQNPARANLEAPLANDRNTAAASLTLNVSNYHPNQKVRDWRYAYKTACDNAYTQATTDMGSTATTDTWNNFDWKYQTSTLDWGNYQEDPATTYSGWVAQAGETETDRNGTGCDLINVVSDGTVSVEATRLDYETSKYGKGTVYGTRSDTQRTCKIRRTRTPELLLEYQPSAPSGTDTSKAAAFWHVNYQPPVADGQPPAERFKLYYEAEVFAVKASLADRAPVLCYQPGEALVAHVGAKGIDAVHKAVFRNASGFAGGNKTHCYRHPSSAQLGSPPRPAFAFFDDTAHSAMDSVSVVWQQPSTKIVSKLGSTDDLKMMANSVALVANAVAYADATRTSSFYGTYYTFPTDSSVESPSGWDITGHPTLTLTSTFRQHVAQAKDAAAKTPTSHAMVFKFVDCVFGIEDVAFVDNIASPYALQTEWAGASSMKTK